MPWQWIVAASILVAVLVTLALGRTGPGAVMVAGLAIGIAGVLALVVAFVVGLDTIDGRSSAGVDLLFIGSVAAILAGFACWLAGVCLWVLVSVVRRLE